MEITAIFDNVDRAEWALVRLREQGLHPKKYRITPLRAAGSASGGGMTNSRLDLLDEAPLAAMTLGQPMMTADNGQPWGALGGAALLPLGGLLNSSAVGESRRHEGSRQEVRLRMICASGSAERIRGILVSNGGRGI